MSARAREDPAETFPACEYLREELAARGWHAADLAAAIGLSLPETEALLRGERWITASLSERLGRAFGCSEAFWMRLDHAGRRVRE